MIIVILIIILFGTAPFGFGDDPEQPDCTGPDRTSTPSPDGCARAGMQRAWQDPSSPTGGCDAAGASLLMRRGDTTVLVDPPTGAVRAIPVSPDAVRVIDRGWYMLAGAVPGPWLVTQIPDGMARRIAVYERQSGNLVLDAAFARRIELSTAAVSATGRYTVHVQGNNLASEVTVLDAQRGVVWQREIWHDARLAAYAISVAYDPREACAAISMERVGGDGAETWLLDLWAGDLWPLPVPDVSILTWTRHQV